MNYEHLPVISASKLKTYRTCAKKYQLQYLHNNRSEDKKSVSALLGSALHKAIEMYYRTGDDAMTTHQNYMSQGMQEWEEQGYHINGIEWHGTNFKEGAKMIKLFDFSRFAPYELEYEFKLPFPNYENPYAVIHGFIDLEDHDHSVIDHKSTKTLPKKDELDNDAQFILYAWAFKMKHGMLPSNVYWNHLRTGKLISIDVFTDFDKKLNKLEDDIQALLNNKYWARINLSDTCRTRCSFYNLCWNTSKDIEYIAEDE